MDPVFGGPGPATFESLAELAHWWSARPFPGKLWCASPAIGFASPAYADSVIVSGPAELIEQLRANQLEIFRVAPSHRLPTMIL